MRDGARIYARSCSVCHGERGAGAAWGRQSLRPPPRDFTTVAARRELTRDRMIASITYGRPGTAMSAWSRQLDPADIEAVVHYIDTTLIRSAEAGRSASEGGTMSTEARGRTRAPRATPSRVDMTAGMPGALSGDVRVGRELYERNCAECHGAKGDGNGPRAYFIVPRPRDFLDRASRRTFDRPALFRAIRDGVIGREMPAWGKVLDDRQIADVGEYVFQAFIRGVPGERRLGGDEGVPDR